jgi:hypothetical protein
MLLIYSNAEAIAALPEAEQQAVYAEVDRVLGELRASGELVAGDGLAPPPTGRIVRSRDGVVAVTDGPYAEAKEVLGGFYLIEAADLDEAIRWAAQIPAAWRGKVELRPVVPMQGGAARR